ncbi:MAG TPA: SdiA-regulated domain-containing protein, partial [Flavisolibacter sp.]|nr:SdiA-regulated domain-containing protein [Flavisolibacter sp.]
MLKSLLVCAVTLTTACNQQSYNSPEGYDLNKPQKMELGKVLNEISGITYYQENNALLAISDSKEKVFEINVDKRKLKDFTDRVIGPQNDIEDVARVDSIIYLLSSKGRIYTVPMKKRNDSSAIRSYDFSSDEKNDFETLYYDPGVSGLVMLCKTCAFDKSEDVHSAFRFDLATNTFDSTALYTIDDKAVNKVLKDDNAKFKPSAAAIHPVNKRLYILSSAGNLLVVADNKGQPIEAYHLNPDEFPQAEGIAFAPNGDMYISNEGKQGKPTLLLFPYHENKKN